MSAVRVPEGGTGEDGILPLPASPGSVPASWKSDFHGVFFLPVAFFEGQARPEIPNPLICSHTVPPARWFRHHRAPKMTSEQLEGGVYPKKIPPSPQRSLKIHTRVPISSPRGGLDPGGILRGGRGGSVAGKRRRKRENIDNFLVVFPFFPRQERRREVPQARSRLRRHEDARLQLLPQDRRPREGLEEIPR